MLKYRQRPSFDPFSGQWRGRPPKPRTLAERRAQGGIRLTYGKPPRWQPYPKSRDDATWPCLWDYRHRLPKDQRQNLTYAEFGGLPDADRERMLVKRDFLDEWSSGSSCTRSAASDICFSSLSSTSFWPPARPPKLGADHNPPVVASAPKAIVHPVVHDIEHPTLHLESNVLWPLACGGSPPTTQPPPHGPPKNPSLPCPQKKYIPIT